MTDRHYELLPLNKLHALNPLNHLHFPSASFTPPMPLLCTTYALVKEDQRWSAGSVSAAVGLKTMSDNGSERDLHLHAVRIFKKDSVAVWPTGVRMPVTIEDIYSPGFQVPGDGIDEFHCSSVKSQMV